MQVTNSQISLRGDKSALMPTLDAVVNVANNGLAGEPNDAVRCCPAARARPTPVLHRRLRQRARASCFRATSRITRIGFNLNIPLRNRAAQADLINDELTLRQQQLALQRLENQVRVDVQNAVIALQQARARYQAAIKARVLQEQTVDAEQKKFALGASTIYNVILAQRDLANAQSMEVAAMSNYAKARVELDRATGQTLNNHNISMAEAFSGSVSRAPAPPPVVPQP